MRSRSILGPALGGALAQPCENYPTIFARGTILDRFPFLLPNLVCAVILAVGVVVGILFLEETHEEMKHRRDVGVEVGRWILHRFANEPVELEHKFDDANIQVYQYQALLEDEEPPGYRTRDGSPLQPSSRSQSPSVAKNYLESCNGRRQKRNLGGFKKPFTKQVILNIIGFGILA